MLSIKIRPLWSPSDEENVWRYERVNQKSLYHWTDKTMNKRKTKDEKTKQWIKEKQKTKRQTMNGKRLFRKLMIEQHDLYYNLDVKSDTPEG